ncbi:MAG: hypothetical protein ABI266_04455, partial [Ginsengibacter sp.]
FLTWYFLVSPLITRWIKSRLKIHEKNNQVQMNAVLSLLPATDYLFKKSWKLSATKKGIKRMRLFWKIILMNTLKDVNVREGSGNLDL